MRKIFVIAALLFGAVPLMIQAKSPVPVKKQYKHPLIEQKLDSIIFSQITVENVTLEKCVAEISRSSGSFDAAGTGVKVVLFREKHPTHNQTYMRLKKLPLITLDMKNVTLRQLLDELKKQTKCNYKIEKDHVEFIHEYVKKGSEK